jgi:hypothetical protein
MSDDLTGWAQSPNEPSPAAGPPGAELPAARVARALTCALFGLLVFPVALQIWSLWLLLTVDYSSLGSSSRRKYWTALCIDAAALLGIATLIYLALTGQLPTFPH